MRWSEIVIGAVISQNLQFYTRFNRDFAVATPTPLLGQNPFPYQFQRIKSAIPVALVKPSDGDLQTQETPVWSIGGVGEKVSRFATDVLGPQAKLLNKSFWLVISGIEVLFLISHSGANLKGVGATLVNFGLDGIQLLGCIPGLEPLDRIGSILDFAASKATGAKKLSPNDGARLGAICGGDVGLYRFLEALDLGCEIGEQWSRSGTKSGTTGPAYVNGVTVLNPDFSKSRTRDRCLKLLLPLGKEIEHPS